MSRKDPRVISPARSERIRKPTITAMVTAVILIMSNPEIVKASLKRKANLSIFIFDVFNVVSGDVKLRILFLVPQGEGIQRA